MLLTERIGCNLLTHSRMACFKTCPRRHFLCYEQGIRQTVKAEPLRVGGAFHLGVEVLNKTRSFREAHKAICANYAQMLAGIEDTNAWFCECRMVAHLLAAYAWRWSESKITTEAVETPFNLPLVNPDTGRPSTVFRIAGKRDKRIRLEDGRLALMETKTTSADIAPESDYWTRLRRDHQLSLYVLAEHMSGHDVETVVYDVVRKPALKPLKATPDDKRKYRKDGQLYANLRERDETSEEYGQRIGEALTADPDRYFARREVSRPKAELDLFQHELWQMQQVIREAQRSGYWFRNTNACINPLSRCEFHEVLCDMDIDAETPLPMGWERVDNIHPELEEHDADTTGSAETAASAAKRSGTGR